MLKNIPIMLAFNLNISFNFKDTAEIIIDK